MIDGLLPHVKGRGACIASVVVIRACARLLTSVLLWDLSRSRNGFMSALTNALNSLRISCGGDP